MASYDNTETDGAFKCCFCGKVFSSPSDLEEHKNETDHHGMSDLRYRCEQCNFAVNYGDDFYQHKKTHIVERPFKCSYCPQTFLFNSKLKHHERSHTGERPYRCGICGKSYKTNSTLGDHVKRVHNRLKPY